MSIKAHMLLRGIGALEVYLESVKEIDELLLTKKTVSVRTEASPAGKDIAGIAHLKSEDIVGIVVTSSDADDECDG